MSFKLSKEVHFGEMVAEAGRDFGVIKGLQPFSKSSESASYFYLYMGAFRCGRNRGSIRVCFL